MLVNTVTPIIINKFQSMTNLTMNSKTQSQRRNIFNIYVTCCHDGQGTSVDITSRAVLRSQMESALSKGKKGFGFELPWNKNYKLAYKC